MQDSKAAEPREAEKQGRWSGMVKRVKDAGKHLRIDTDQHFDQSAKYLQDKGVISQRHDEMFDTAGSKIKRVSAWYDNELKNGAYTIRIKPVLNTRLDATALEKELKIELGLLMRKSGLMDHRLTYIGSNSLSAAGYIELTVNCSKDGWYLRTVSLMNGFLEECIKKYELLRK